MFQQAELDPTIDHVEYERREPPLRTALLQRQYALLGRRDRAVLLVIAGIDGAGKGSTVNLLNEWLDPRHMHTLAFGEPSADEAQRPAMWRYWNALPEAGHIGIVFGSWYLPLMKEAARKRPDPERLARMAAGIVRFEAMLAAERVQVVKLWYHLSARAQAARIDAQLADPNQAWRVSKADLQVRRRFERLRAASQAVIESTYSAHAPWQVIPGADGNMRSLSTGEALLEALRSPLPRVAPVEPIAARPNPEPALDRGELPPSPPDYSAQLDAWQARLALAVRHKRFARRTLVLVFEGVDAAGKGGAIRRVTRALDARQLDVVPVGPPTDEERARPYLWRFWRRLPLHGRVIVFDRSWYGRVLVERVEGLCRPADWRRAYGEINDFESQLHDHGAIVIKFWLSISKQEQLDRFHARSQTPFKSFKLTPDDWRNRRKWDDYLHAARDMLARTDTEAVPWRLIATDDKHAARLDILREIVEELERRLRD